MKKTKSVFKNFIIITVLLALISTGCAKIQPDATQSTPAPTSASATAINTPAPKIPYTVANADLIDKYTLKLPGYEPVDRSATTPEKVKSSRYKKKNSDWYQNKDTSDTETATLMFTGDLMCQTRQQEAALQKYGEYKFNQSFKYVKKIFSQADLAVGNLETTLCAKAPYMSEQKEVDGKPHCNAPAEYLSALRYAGFDAVVTANNHNCDAGVYGILDTLDCIDEYKLMHTGTFSDSKQQRFLLIDVNGIKLALMSYATYYNLKDAYITDEGKQALLNQYSKAKVEQDVKYAKAMGAEFIIAYNHWGTEYTNTENEKQIRWAQEMADAGVDYIIGSHPHALQRYDVLTAKDGRQVPCVYSMGNFISHMTKTVAQDTVILRIELKRTENGIEIASEGYIPCRVFITFKGTDYLILPITQEYNNGTKSRYFNAAYKRITSVMGDKIQCLGTLADMDEAA